MSERAQRRREVPARLQLDGLRQRDERNARTREEARQATLERQRAARAEVVRQEREEGLVDVDELIGLERDIFQQFCKREYRCLEENFRVEYIERFTHFFLSISFRRPTDLALGTHNGASDVNDWNRIFCRDILPKFQTEPDWTNEPDELLLVYRRHGVQNPREPFIFKLNVNFSSNDGSRFITEHFQRQHLNSALIKAIAVFLEPSWAELPDDYVFCTVVGTLKRIFLSLEKMTMYCSRCNLVFDENAHKEHVAKHHKELFDRTYGRMLVDEANDAEFCRIVNRSAIGRQLKDHILRNADYWIDMYILTITARDQQNNDLEQLRLIDDN